MRSRSLFSIDILILLCTLVLIVIGILFIYSSGITSTGVLYSNEYIKQIIWATTGLILMMVFAFLNYRLLRDFALYIYLFFVLLLIITLFFGETVNGARSWIGVWQLGIQPSEFCKIATILFLAKYLSENTNRIKDVRVFLIALGIILVPVGLILLQPDMGTALSYIPVFLIMTFIAGAKLRHVLFVFCMGLLTIILAILPTWETYLLDNPQGFFSILDDSLFIQGGLIVLGSILLLSGLGVYFFKRQYYYWIMYGDFLLFSGFGFSILAKKFLYDYQIMRLIVFLNPSIDPKGSGWNIIQSVTAVGSGGFWGKGFLKGTQSHYRYLPQQSTDFIFSVIAEEWGFVGAFIVFSLFLIIFIRALMIMVTARDSIGGYICGGILAVLFFHFLINVGMTMGIMPITGIPLIFLSYGGSSLWTGLISIGILMNIYLQRYD